MDNRTEQFVARIARTETQHRQDIHQDWQPLAVQHGLQIADGWGERYVLTGTRAQWQGFFRAVYALDIDKMSPADKGRRTRLLKRIWFQAFGLGGRLGF